VVEFPPVFPFDPQAPGRNESISRDRTQPDKQGGRWLAGKVGLDGLREPGVGVAGLAAAGLHHRQQTLHESAARRRLRAEGQLPPDDHDPRPFLVEQPAEFGVRGGDGREADRPAGLIVDTGPGLVFAEVDHQNGRLAAAVVVLVFMAQAARGG
jgi:hypothetical protein